MVQWKLPTFLHIPPCSLPRQSPTLPWPCSKIFHLFILNPDELIYLTASEARLLFQSGELSPVDLMQAMIERSEAVEPQINAFCDRYFDEAMFRARKAEKRYATPSVQPGPLEGIPVAVKDDTAIQGRRSCAGSLFRRDHIDGQTHPSVERLIHSGAIVHARTTCPEFCWTWVTATRLNGITRNPWNPYYSPGGSSGGSAAALAAGSTMLATGTDSAGSIRQPAALCGIVGFKPPHGRNPQSPDVSFDVYNHIGPMARSVQDCLLMQNVMAGPHPLDHHCVSPKLQIPENPGEVSGMRIAYSMDLGCYAVSSDVRRETRKALDRLETAGARIEAVETPWAADAIEMSGHYGDHLYSDDFDDAVSRYPDLVCEYTPWFAGQLRRITRRQVHDAHRLAGEIWHRHFGPLLNEFDVFICPTTTSNNLPADLLPWESVTVNGRKLSPDETALTILFNLYSRCPVLSVPAGFTRTGMPVGIQIIGGPYDDVPVFRVGSALERSANWFQSENDLPDFKSR